MAVTKDGKLYSWGYGDGGWLGTKPSNIQHISLHEETAVQLPYTSVCTFNSKYSLIIPQKNKLLQEWYVKKVSAGQGHTLILCDERDINTEEYESAAGYEGITNSTTRPNNNSKKSIDPDLSLLLTWCRCGNTDKIKQVSL